MNVPSDPIEIPIPVVLHRRLRRHRHRIAAARTTWRRFASHRFGVVGLAWIAVLAIVALFPDVFALHPPTWSQLFGVLSIQAVQSGGDVTLPPFISWIVVPPIVLVVLTAASFYFVSYSLEDLGGSRGEYSGGAGGRSGPELPRRRTQSAERRQYRD